MTATLLETGQVLIAGGDSANNTSQAMAEIYDPSTNSFTPSGSLNHGRLAHTATQLEDGNVLFAGGNSGSPVLASAEIYNPETGEFTLTGDLNGVRHKHAAVLLQNGDVLVIGGSNQNDWRGQYNSAEIYDASTGLFSRTADMNRERFKLAEAAVLLKDGNVLIGGGNRQIEIFDAAAGLFVLDGELDGDYYFSVLTVLMDGRVLITGGYDAGIQPSDQAWIYN
jgi:WD40 repeat protein